MCSDELPYKFSKSIQPLFRVYLSPTTADKRFSQPGMDNGVDIWISALLRKTTIRVDVKPPEIPTVATHIHSSFTLKSLDDDIASCFAIQFFFYLPNTFVKRGRYIRSFILCRVSCRSSTFSNTYKSIRFPVCVLCK